MAVFATPVNPDPSPKKLVALTTPTTFNFSTGDDELIPTFKSVLTLYACSLANLDKLRALDILSAF